MSSSRPTSTKPSPTKHVKHVKHAVERASAPRRDFSRAHRRSYFLVCILSIVVVGCALGLVCGQATYNRECPRR